MIRIALAHVVIALGLTVVTSGAGATSIINGSLTGPPGERRVPSGWWQYQGNTSDTADSNGPFGTYNLSPDGGTFVRSFSWQRDTDPGLYRQREGLEQTLTDLVVGQIYTVSFYQTSLNGINSISGLPFAGAAGQWSLMIDGVAGSTSELMAPPPGTSLDNSWSLQSLSFVALADTHLLSLLATVPDSAPVNTRTFMGIDGVAMAAVPEPGASTLFALGIALLAPWQRFRRAPPCGARGHESRRR